VIVNLAKKGFSNTLVSVLQNLLSVNENERPSFLELKEFLK